MRLRAGDAQCAGGAFGQHLAGGDRQAATQLQTVGGAVDGDAGVIGEGERGADHMIAVVDIDGSATAGHR